MVDATDTPRTGGTGREALRIASTTVAIAALTCGLFFWGMWIASVLSPSLWAFGRASALLQIEGPLWYTALFASTGIGIAWYVAPWWRTRRAPTRGLAALDRMQRQGAAAVAIAWYGVLGWGLCFADAFMPGRSVSPLLAFEHWEGVMRAHPRIFEAAAALGALVATLAAIQAWNVLPRGFARVRFAALLGAILAAGFVAEREEAFRAIPGTVPRHVAEDAATRGLTPHAAAEGMPTPLRVTIETYLTSYDGFGDRLDLWELRFERRIGYAFRNDPDVPDAHDVAALVACDEVRLPEVAVWAPTGIGIRLDDSKPRAEMPTRVLEIPRRPDEARVRQPGSRKLETRIARHEIAAAVDGSDWIVLKVDAWTEARGFAAWLEAFRDAGVRQVDLAAIPQGFRKMPEATPIVHLPHTASSVAKPNRGMLETWVPREIGRVKRRPSVRHLIDGKPPETRPTCEVDEDGTVRAWARRFEVPAPESTPKRVALSMHAGATYGDLMGRLQGAIAGGADEIAFRFEETHRASLAGGTP